MTQVIQSLAGSLAKVCNRQSDFTLSCIMIILFSQSIINTRASAEELIISGEVFNHFKNQSSSAQNFNSFDLERAELGIQSSQDPRWGGELRLEAVRSAGPDSLMGIDGDSFVMRLKRAWGFGKFQSEDWSFTARYGLIPDQWHLMVMRAFPLRSIGPSQGEREGMQETSDLGFCLDLEYQGHRLFMSLTNGEGRRYQDQNVGKNILIGAQFSAELLNGILHVSTAYRDGSKGPNASRDHRLYLSSVWSSQHLSIGTIGSRAWGLKDRASLTANALQTWIAAWLIPKYLGAYLNFEWVRYQHISPIALETDELSTQPFDLDRDALEWGFGFSHQLYSRMHGPMMASQDVTPVKGTSSDLRLTLFEALRYRGASNLKSPIYGVPQLAEEWSISLILQLSWGPAPLHTSPEGRALLF